MFSWMKVAAIVGVSGALMLGSAGAQVLNTPADTTPSTPPAPVLHHSNPNHTVHALHTSTHTGTHHKHLTTKHHKHYKLHTKGHKLHTLHSTKHKAHTTHGWKHHPKNV